MSISVYIYICRQPLLFHTFFFFYLYNPTQDKNIFLLHVAVSYLLNICPAVPTVNSSAIARTGSITMQYIYEPLGLYSSPGLSGGMPAAILNMNSIAGPNNTATYIIRNEIHKINATFLSYEIMEKLYHFMYGSQYQF